MDEELNPQRAQMADESMVRNLAAQAEAIWPQELPLIERYGLAANARILDAGCGTGEITRRLGERFPDATVLGVDVLEGPLAIARARAAHLAPRVRFEQRSVFQLGLRDGEFDLTVCRHVLQSIPHADRVLAELARVTRRGGRLHLICEDYGMIHFPIPGAPLIDADAFWHVTPREFGAATGTDLFIGRHAPAILRRLGLSRITVDYVVVDPLRVPRETFAAICTAWRDGYVDAIGQHTSTPSALARQTFDDMIATLRDPDSYAVWMVPVIGAVVP
jgi:SAM-dependent methyltransferase